MEQDQCNVFLFELRAYYYKESDPLLYLISRRDEFRVLVPTTNRWRVGHFLALNEIANGRRDT